MRAIRTVQAAAACHLPPACLLTSPADISLSPRAALRPFLIHFAYLTSTVPSVRFILSRLEGTFFEKWPEARLDKMLMILLLTDGFESTVLLA